MAYKRNLAFPLAPTVSDPGDKPKKKKRKTNRATDREDRRKRKAEIKRQATKSRSGLKADGTYSVDVSGERKVKKKVAKIQKKIDKVSDKKDERQKKLVKSGVRRETRKNQLLQKQVEAKRVESGKQSQIKEKKDRSRSDDGGNKKKKNTKFKTKLRGKRGAYKGKGGSEVKFCRPGAAGKRKACKHNV